MPRLSVERTGRPAMLAAAALLSVSLAACFFLTPRASRPGSQPPAEAPSAVAVAPGGAPRAAGAAGPAKDEAVAPAARLAEAFARLPLQFEANQGQADARAGFIASGGGYDLFLTPGGAVFSLRAGAETEARAGDRAKPTSAARPVPRADALRMTFAGAKRNARPEGREMLPGKTNYFGGGPPLTGIPNYARVTYAEVYDGVDVTFYGNRRRLEYDFIVKPGADPSAIRLKFEGARGLGADGGGELVLRTRGGGELRQHKPFVYQETAEGRREVAGRYRLGGGGEVGFEVAAYDRSRPLVIDPVTTYSSYLGGNNYDAGSDIAVDAAGNAFPDWIEVAFAGPRTIHEVSVFGLQDNFQSPVEPTGEMTSSTYALNSFAVEYWTGSGWAVVPGGAVVGNNKVWRRVTFPALTTTKIRVSVRKALGSYNRIVEVEAY
jgi:hypothetical protein